MERGEEEAVRAAAMHFSAAIFADVQARSFRRAAAENCRPAIFEARATLREQSGSTLGRRVYAQACPRLLGIEECPQFREFALNDETGCVVAEREPGTVQARHRRGQ